MNFCGLRKSNSKTSSFYVGESSQAPLYVTKKSELQKGYGTSCTYELRHVSDNQVQFTHDQATGEQTTIETKQEHRRVANRRSAQRSRERKQKFITDLENKEKLAKENVTTLRAKIEILRQMNNLLQLDKKRVDDQVFTLAFDTKVRGVTINSTKCNIELMKLHNLESARRNEEPDLTLSLSLPNI